MSSLPDNMKNYLLRHKPKRVFITHHGSHDGHSFTLLEALEDAIVVQDNPAGTRVIPHTAIQYLAFGD